jgi:hypothetical protein
LIEEEEEDTAQLRCFSAYDGDAIWYVEYPNKKYQRLSDVEIGGDLPATLNPEPKLWPVDRLMSPFRGSVSSPFLRLRHFSPIVLSEPIHLTQNADPYTLVAPTFHFLSRQYNA